MSRIPLVMVVVVALGASAAGAEAGPHQGPQRPAGDMSPLQVHELFDAMLAMQAQDVLALDETQYAQFLTRLKALQDARRRHQQERMKLLAELQRMTNPRGKGVPEAAITERLRALEELESNAAAELRRAYTDVDAVLTPLQRARFRVLEEQIERRKLELVGRARQNNQRQPARRPPGG